MQEGAYCPVKAINLQDCQEMKRGLQGAQLLIHTQVCVHNLAFWQTLKKSPQRTTLMIKPNVKNNDKIRIYKGT